MTSSRECFCGCDLEIATANQLAGNLLGWDFTTEFGEWMQVLLPIYVSSPGRDYSEEQFNVDGREMWLSLRKQVHGGVPQTREDRRITKRWLKFSKKEREKLEKRLNRGGIGAPFQDVDFLAPEIRNWVHRGEWPDWVTAATERDEDSQSRN
jgi:hypothetical protein